MSAKITAALHAVMQDVPYVQKTGVNQFHKYRYAGEADLLEKLRPALLRHGLLLIPSAQEASPADQHGNVTVRVEYTLAHKDGDVWPEKIGAVGCGNDRSKDGRVGDKGVYKALTGANKYLLFKLFQIETGDDPEQDTAHEQPLSRKQPPEPQPVALSLGYDTRAAVSMTQGSSKNIYIERAIGRMGEMESAPQLLEWAQKERKMVWPQFGIEPHDEDGQRLVAAYKERMAVFEQAALTEAAK